MGLEKLIDLSQCPKLIKKYKGIISLPLDLPNFELDDPDEFWRIWNEEVDRVSRQKIDRGAVGTNSPSLDHTQWDGLALYEDESLLKDAAWLTKVSTALAETQPTYLKRIMSELPYVRIRSVRLWSAHTTITPHYDGNMPPSLDGIMRFPTEIRIMLDDKNPKETFWLCSNEKYQPNTKKSILKRDRYYVKLPTDTNTFIWNNEDSLHGADFEEPYRKILVVIKGWIDVNRLEEMLDRSIAKYPEYIIRFKKTKHFY
jgi:hypothetical protein